MAQSYEHAKASARHFGGKPEDYIKIHEFIDQSKRSYGDVRHRAMFHHTAGPWVCQEVFGHTIINAESKKINVRQIAENHITEDLGCIPSPSDWYDCMNCKAWMGGKRNKFIGREELLDQTLKEAK